MGPPGAENGASQVEIATATSTVTVNSRFLVAHGLTLSVQAAVHRANTHTVANKGA